MIVLGIDTALKSCSAAILDGGRALAERRLALDKGHAEHLAPLVVEALASAKVAVADLDRVGVVIGPGGFAGVRVGLAFARGLALGTRLNVVGVTSLEALAASSPPLRGGEFPPHMIAAVIDARRGQVYAALYADGAVMLAPFVASPDEARRRILAAASSACVIVGDGATLIDPDQEHFARIIADEIDPKVVARLAAAAPEPSAPPAPLYLRPPDAKPPKPSRFEALFNEDAP